MKMIPSKIEQVTKFHTPFADEDPNQLYVILEINEDGERTRAKIIALNTNLSFPPIYIVKLNDLEVVEIL